MPLGKQAGSMGARDASQMANRVGATSLMELNLVLAAGIHRPARLLLARTLSTLTSTPLLTSATAMPLGKQAGSMGARDASQMANRVGATSLMELSLVLAAGIHRPARGLHVA